MIRRAPRSALFPDTTLFRSREPVLRHDAADRTARLVLVPAVGEPALSRELGDVRERLVQPLGPSRSEEHTSELQSRQYHVCRLLLENKTNCERSFLHLLPPA